jgi:hypothetical protein
LAAFFFDSSALAKIYHREIGTAEVDGIIRAPDSQILISRLSVVELSSVFAIIECCINNATVTAKKGEGLTGRCSPEVWLAISGFSQSNG